MTECIHLSNCRMVLVRAYIACYHAVQIVSRSTIFSQLHFLTTSFELISRNYTTRSLRQNCYHYS